MENVSELKANTIKGRSKYTYNFFQTVRNKLNCQNNRFFLWVNNAILLIEIKLYFSQR